ncbi:hypothetical protein EJ05DRAFT_532524 [Pseudovirgaria hyperparasitica]|uniref:RmlC-like cupin n=1 Tax=Pseudovirgaria hyperparasitica TaxID=470096 RepID=A0A6A6W540_9PEZI|nr:uncharacterized protein EJ05DRAFT_532524 [Pseudovirgaria hyperparasitica]KAF2756677.1 hypothetical protein EJ05DRAFT_532524 [Pseudovirgaria hyperparasitica]
MSPPPPFPNLPTIPPASPSLTNPPHETTPRKIALSFLATEQSEGAGARVRRSIGSPKLRRLSPFLMLDHFSISPGAGFPDHPHRGQETITYLLAGAVDHEDFAGNRGTIETGDLQFMTAGRGVVHAEMPRQTESADGIGSGSANVNVNVGLQLWVDLPRRLKMCEPRYRDLRAGEIPRVVVDAGRVEVRVISGRSHGVDSVRELAYTPVWLLDVRIRPGGRIVQALPVGWNAFAYTIAGTTVFGGAGGDGQGGGQQTVPQHHNVVFEQRGDTVLAEVPGDAAETGHFILVAGVPLDQEVVQYGPFVLGSREEVYQALRDYSTCSNGFERAEGWRSEIGRAMMGR